MQVVQPYPTTWNRSFSRSAHAGRRRSGSRSTTFEPGARRRLHPRLGHQPLRDRLLGQQAGGHHHRRVGRVRATRDGGDDHRPVLDRAGCELAGRRRPGVPVGRDGRIVSAAAGGRLLGRLGGLPSASAARRANDLLHVRQRHAVLRAARPGQARHHRRQVEFAACRSSPPRRRPCAWNIPCSLKYASTSLTWCSGRPVVAEVVERLGVDREDAAGRPVLGGHVGDRRPVGQRQFGQAGAVELDELADHALLAEHLRDGQHQVGGGRPFAAACRTA